MKKENNTFEEIWNELKKSDKILMTLHYRPDGDSLGSCTAMKCVLEKLGKNVTLISKDNLSENLNEFEFSKEVRFRRDIQEENLDEFDCILLLDYGAAPNDFSEEFMEKLKKHKTINIDHHNTNNHFGYMNYVDNKSPSCCSILIEMFKKINIEFHEQLCRRLLLGICTDTYFGAYDKTAETLKKMSFLVEKGKINYQREFVDRILSNPWKLKKLWGILLSNMEKIEIGGKTVAYSWATKEEYEKFGLNYADIRLGITCIQDIKNLDLVFTLTEMEDHIKGSFRSKNLDTTIYSEELGGGGHKKASAFVTDKESMRNVVDKVLEMIKRKGFLEIE